MTPARKTRFCRSRAPSFNGVKSSADGYRACGSTRARKALIHFAKTAFQMQNAHFRIRNIQFHSIPIAFALQNGSGRRTSSCRKKGGGIYEAERVFIAAFRYRCGQSRRHDERDDFPYGYWLRQMVRQRQGLWLCEAVGWRGRHPAASKLRTALGLQDHPGGRHRGMRGRARPARIAGDQSRLLGQLHGTGAAGRYRTAEKLHRRTVRSGLCGSGQMVQPRQGYGFASRGAGTPDIFVHMETLRRCNIVELREGQNVTVRLGDGPKGDIAAHIVLVKE
jgi:cold shock CspA family protein